MVEKVQPVASRQRHQSRVLTLERAQQAIRRLYHAGQAVTFCGVAAEAGVFPVAARGVYGYSIAWCLSPPDGLGDDARRAPRCRCRLLGTASASFRFRFSGLRPECPESGHCGSDVWGES